MHSIDILLNKGLKLKPDIAVMMHNINDLTILLHEKDYWNNNLYRSLVVTVNNMFLFLLRNYIFFTIDSIYNLLIGFQEKLSSIDEFAHSRGKKINIDQEEIIKKFSRNLQAFVSICKHL